MEALFEEGDVVEKDQVLYRIDASSMDSDLSSAETSLLRARESQQSAQEDYNEAAGTLSGNTYKASVSGYVKMCIRDSPGIFYHPAGRDVGQCP